MASVTQTIPNYIAGVSEVPDQLKNPGQVKNALNVLPSVDKGLEKRPGSEYVRSLTIDPTGTWFHYYRDDEEQYIGQIGRNHSVGCGSNIRMWSLRDQPNHPSGYVLAGDEMDVDVAETGREGINTYLNHSTDEDLQFLTINDYTYVVNRTKVVSMSTSTAPDRPHRNAAFIFLKKTANARQYGLNVFRTNATTDVTTATRIKHKEVYPSTPFTRHDGTSWNDKLATDTSGGGSTAAAEHKSPNITERPFHSRQWIYSGTNYYPRNLATCPDIGTAVYSSEDVAPLQPNIKIYKSDGTQITDGSRKNLRWRFTVKGRSHLRANTSTTPAGPDYICTYDYDVELLPVGEGWQKGDYVQFTADASGFTDDDEDGALRVVYYIEISEIETAKVKCSLTTGNKDGLVRPSPTPFDSTVSISSTGILGGIEQNLADINSGITTTIIGNVIYLNTPNGTLDSNGIDPNRFNVETSESDLIQVMTDEINDISQLPTQCKHGYIVKIANSGDDDDDYYLKFKGDNDLDGPGAWVECAKPGIKNKLDPATMPMQIVRKDNGSFQVQQPNDGVNPWGVRDVGEGSDDDGANTNPEPSFVGSTINNILFWRNRVVLLSDANAICSRPGGDNLTNPNFWVNTALTISPDDPIDLSASSTSPAKLFDGIEVTAGLVLMSANAQFLLTTDSDTLTPETATINSLATYNYNTKVNPISLGTTVGFLDNAGKTSRFFEMVNIQRAGEPTILDQTITIPSLLPKNLNLISSSKENTYAIFSKTGTTDMYGYKYFNTGEKRVQSAWFKWTVRKNVVYHCIMDDSFFTIDEEGHLVKFELRDTSTASDLDVTVDANNKLASDFSIHLDYNQEFAASEITYDSATRKSYVTLPSGYDDVGTIALIDDTPNDGTWNNFGRYGVATFQAASGGTPAKAVVDGDWTQGSHSIYVGYLYEMQVDFPTIYMTKTGPTATVSDTRGSLVVHRVKLELGPCGVYETLVKRVGKDDYTEVFESSLLDNYMTNTTPWLEEHTHTIPTYERNTNLEFSLKSSHPSPTTLYSMSWEGDYTNKFYQRV